VIINENFFILASCPLFLGEWEFLFGGKSNLNAKSNLTYTRTRFSKIFRMKYTYIFLKLIFYKMVLILKILTLNLKQIYQG
jgi:hypothetical protein